MPEEKEEFEGEEKKRAVSSRCCVRSRYPRCVVIKIVLATDFQEGTITFSLHNLSVQQFVLTTVSIITTCSAFLFRPKSIRDQPSFANQTTTTTSLPAICHFPKNSNAKSISPTSADRLCGEKERKNLRISHPASTPTPYSVDLDQMARS